MKTKLLGIIIAVGIFFGFQVIMPFPYGFILSLVVMALILWYVFKKLTLQNIPVFSNIQRLEFSPERKIQYSIIFLFAFSFVSSVLYPFVNDVLGLPTAYKVEDYGQSTSSESLVWPQDTERLTFLDGVMYRSGFVLFFIVFPIYLVPPAHFVMPRAFFWILAIISIFVINYTTKKLSVKRRCLYAYLSSSILASMWASFFIWHPSYDSTIIPGVWE
jgi:hypothetical protein